MAIPTVIVQNVGRVSYGHGLKLQQSWQRAHLQQLKQRTSFVQKFISEVGSDGCHRIDECHDVPDTLILCEHDPVYTVGIRKDGFDEVVKKLQRMNLLCDYYKTNRGGLITFHGPGQLICYPIINLDHFKKSIRWYVSALENCLITTCNYFNVSAKTTQYTGVWVGEQKIAAIGIRAARWITLHGVALNCNTDLTWFDHITPCGIEGKGVTSLSVECKKQITVQDVIEPFIESFCDSFNCKAIFSQEQSSID